VAIADAATCKVSLQIVVAKHLQIHICCFQQPNPNCQLPRLHLLSLYYAPHNGGLLSGVCQRAELRHAYEQLCGGLLVCVCAVGGYDCRNGYFLSKGEAYSIFWQGIIS